MKKIYLLFMCFFAGAVFLSGCSNEEPFEKKSYTPDVQIHEINLDVRDRAIEVSLSKDEQIHIRYLESTKESYDIAILDGTILKMTSISNKNWTDYLGRKTASENRKIWLQIPDTMLDNLTLSTTNEDISLPALAVTGNISLSTNGGNLSFEKLTTGSALTLSVKNGDISGAIAGSYEDYSIESNIKKGESNLPSQKADGTKKLNVSCNHGDVAIEFVNNGQ